VKFRGDATLTHRMLASASIAAEPCADLSALCRGIAEGAGAIFLAEEALVRPAVTELLDVLGAQPAWSDLPVIVSSLEREIGYPAIGAALANCNVTLLDRPVAMRTMLSQVKAALRARMRQYEARALIEQLAEARELAEKHNRIKDAFLATVSHELRTPLNAILGWARMLASGQLEASKQPRAITAIERNAVAQARLIEDLLDVSRIISGKISLDLQQVDLIGVIEAAVDSVRPAMEAKQIRFSPVVDPTAGPIAGDPQRLQQVFWNLLTNATKFTPKGGRVELRVERFGSNVTVSVIDTGEGIRPDFLPHVFERFQQADGQISRAHGGLGLGLAIARHLVELHGGQISAHSDGEGKGATFRVRLPVASLRASGRTLHPATSERPQFEHPAELVGLRVLLLEDEPDARDLFSVVLERCGSRVTSVQTADDAISRLHAEPFDVIVSDIGLRGDDGYSFIRRVRALPPPSGTIPSAALTAHAGAEHRRKALLAGFQMHISKPIEPAEFVAVVASLARIAMK